jgi:hypothetical protein
VRVSTDSALNHGVPGALVGNYPVATGGVYVWASYDISALETRDVYVEFWAKLPGAKQGFKFLKIFGGEIPGQIYTNNTTFGLNYTGGNEGNGAMYQVSFGDGRSPDNDTANVIFLDGSNPELIGRSYGKATVRTPQRDYFGPEDWGTDWHHFRVHAKFNSGTTAANEVNDGEYYVEIDGKVYVDATGLFNRHYSRGPIGAIAFFDWAQGGTEPFEIWYTDIRISTGGFLP